MNKFLTIFFPLQLKGLKKKAEKKAAVMAPGGKAKVLDPPPDFIAARLAIWDRLKAVYPSLETPLQHLNQPNF